MKEGREEKGEGEDGIALGGMEGERTWMGKSEEGVGQAETPTH